MKNQWEKTTYKRKEEIRRERIKKFNLTSDLFFGKVVSFRNLTNRSIVVDVLAQNEEKEQANLEIQLKDNVNHVKRVRYHVASIDTETLEKSKEFEELPKLYMIYITKKDFLKKKQAIYEVKRTIKGIEDEIPNGIYEYYINLEGKAETAERQKLLDYMVNTSNQEEGKDFPNLVRRVRYLKEEREGVKYMCEILDLERAEGREEGREEGMQVMISALQELQVPEDIMIEKIMKGFLLTREEAQKFINLCV